MPLYLNKVNKPGITNQTFSSLCILYLCVEILKELTIFQHSYEWQLCLLREEKKASIDEKWFELKTSRSYQMKYGNSLYEHLYSFCG